MIGNIKKITSNKFTIFSTCGTLLLAVKNFHESINYLLSHVFYVFFILILLIVMLIFHYYNKGKGDKGLETQIESSKQDLIGSPSTVKRGQFSALFWSIILSMSLCLIILTIGGILYLNNKPIYYLVLENKVAGKQVDPLLKSYNKYFDNNNVNYSAFCPNPKYSESNRNKILIRPGFLFEKTAIIAKNELISDYKKSVNTAGETKSLFMNIYVSSPSTGTSLLKKIIYLNRTELSFK